MQRERYEFSEREKSDRIREKEKREKIEKKKRGRETLISLDEKNLKLKITTPHSEVNF